MPRERKKNIEAITFAKYYPFVMDYDMIMI